MSTIQDRMLLDQIHGNRHSTATTLPTANPAKAAEAVEQSLIQPAKELPQLVVPPESAYDKYEPSFDQQEISNDPLAVARLNNQSITIEENTQLPDQSDWAKETAGFYESVEAMDTEIYQNVATYELGKPPEPSSAETLSETTREKVDLVVTELDKPEKSSAQILSESSAIARSSEVAEIEQGQVEAPPNNLPVTPFAQEKENPLHKQAPLTALETLLEKESPILRPEQEIPLFIPPEVTLVPEAPSTPEPTYAETIAESTHRPTHAPPSPVVAKAEERFQADVMESLQIAAQNQAKTLAEPAVVDRPEVEPVEISPVPVPTERNATEREPVENREAVTPREVREPSEENTVEVPREAIAERPEKVEVEFSVVETAESPMLQDSNAVEQEAATSPQRAELQSQGDVYAREATQNVNAEPMEIPEVDTAPRMEELASELQEEAIAMEAAEIQGIDPEILAEILPNPQAEAREEYVPPVFNQTEVAENPFLEEEAHDYFPPITGAETSLTEEAIAEMTADSYEIPPEYSEPLEFDYEIPEDEIAVTTMTHEELAYLRNNPMTSQYTPEVLEPPVNDVENSVAEEAEEQEIYEENIALEEWVPDAWNMDLNTRYQTQIGDEEIDLTQFQEEMELKEIEESLELKDFDFNEVANRMVESAVTNSPKGMYDTFV
ncbi:MAG: hypothetical protein R3Y63_06650 [Eubacteriales bacterium]